VKIRPVGAKLFYVDGRS